jgi:diadenosine tetraphosphate (Ap4A) HIT family hydrolase
MVSLPYNACVTSVGAERISFKLLETESVLAFVDIGPIAKGHSLVIPKRKSHAFTLPHRLHGEKSGGLTVQIMQLH